MKQENKITLPLWPDGIPDSNGLQGPEIEKEPGFFYNISNPELYFFIPEHSNGKAILMCPGGGMQHVAVERDGFSGAKWFTDRGYTFVVLKYRLPNQHPEIITSDGLQAMRRIKEFSNRFNYQQIGAIGTSAGAYLVAMTSSIATSELRPDFQVLLYGVLTLEEPLTHLPSRNELIGKKPSATDLKQYSPEYLIHNKLPRTFLAHATDDSKVSAANSIRYYSMLTEHIEDVCLHVYPTGQHNFFFAPDFTYKEPFFSELEKWL